MITITITTTMMHEHSPLKNHSTRGKALLMIGNKQENELAPRCHTTTQSKTTNKITSDRKSILDAR
jgi:hypothetical protein